MKSFTPKVSSPLLTQSTHSTWVQTERRTHEEWGRMSFTNARAAGVAHLLAAHCDPASNAVVASYAVLAQLAGVSVATIRRGIDDLVADGWIQAVELGSGSARAYVLHSRVAWSRAREDRPIARFAANVLAARSDQPPEALDATPLRRIPMIRAGEVASPVGPGASPPAQIPIEGLEPVVYISESGARYEVDAETGELQQVMSLDDEIKPAKKGGK